MSVGGMKVGGDVSFLSEGVGLEKTACIHLLTSLTDGFHLTSRMLV